MILDFLKKKKACVFQTNEAPASLFGCQVPDKFYANLVKLVANRKIGSYIFFSETTSLLLQRLGLPSGAISMYANKLREGLLGPDGVPHGHSSSLTSGILNRLAHMIGNPVLVYADEVGKIQCFYNCVDRTGKYPLFVVFTKTHGMKDDKEFALILTIFGRAPFLGQDHLIYYDDQFFDREDTKIPSYFKKTYNILKNTNISGALSKTQFIKEEQQKHAKKKTFWNRIKNFLFTKIL